MNKYNYFHYLSNWLHIWLILFFLKIVPYNPSLAYILGALLCFIIAVLGAISKCVNNIIPDGQYVQFVLILFFSKFIPLYILCLSGNIKYNYTDIYASCVVIGLYILYLHSNGLDIYKIYVIKKLYDGPDYGLML